MLADRLQRCSLFRLPGWKLVKKVLSPSCQSCVQTLPTACSPALPTADLSGFLGDGRKEKELGCLGNRAQKAVFLSLDVGWELDRTFHMPEASRFFLLGCTPQNNKHYKYVIKLLMLLHTTAPEKAVQSCQTIKTSSFNLVDLMRN